MWSNESLQISQLTLNCTNSQIVRYEKFAAKFSKKMVVRRSWEIDKNFRNRSERVSVLFPLLLYCIQCWIELPSVLGTIGVLQQIDVSQVARKKCSLLIVVLIKYIYIYEWNGKHALWDTNSKNREKTRWKFFYLRNKLKHNYSLHRHI